MSIGDPYGYDILGGHKRKAPRTYPTLPAEPGMVVEDIATGWVGAIIGQEKTYDGDFIRLEDRRGNNRLFKLRPGGFLVEGVPTTLTKYVAPKSTASKRSRSGSRYVEGVEAKVALPSRIWVEGIHDAAIVEKIWGHDLRVDGVVVEYLEGLDNLPERLAEFGPGPKRRVGVLADHLVEGTKEMKLPQSLGPHVMVTGHPYIDIWEAVKPKAVHIRQWPTIPYGTDWKTGVCEELGWGDPSDGWMRVYSAVNSFRDLESSLIGAVERLIDFVTEPHLNFE